MTASWKDSFSEGCDPLRTRENIGGGGGLACACCARDWSEVADVSLLGIGGSLQCLSSSSAVTAFPATGLVVREVSRADIGGGRERCSDSVSDCSLKIMEKRSEGEGGQDTGKCCSNTLARDRLSHHMPYAQFTGLPQHRSHMDHLIQIQSRQIYNNV